ncbi:MAG: sterol desaturase family protein [Ignavibacteriae bacterium]|nr:sterol desaturase family protein [Ignavibacteriota bacterium]
MNAVYFILAMTGSFLVMEFVSYLAHRYVYHGIGWRFHQSHHTKRHGIFEKNDVFPLFFATSTTAVMILSLQFELLSWLLPFSIGVSAYGVTYFLIHDIYVHRRSRHFRPRWSYLLKIKKAHAAHHRYGEEPYGLLLFSRRHLHPREKDVTVDEVV